MHAEAQNTGYSQIKNKVIKKKILPLRKRGEEEEIARFFVYTAEKLSYTFIANAKSYDKHC